MSSFTDADSNTPELGQPNSDRARFGTSEVRSRREFVRIAIVAAGTAIFASQTIALGVAGASPMPTLTTPSTTTLSNPGPSTTTHDTVTITGVAPTQTLSGTVNVQYVLDNGVVQQIPNSILYVKTTYNSPLTVTFKKGNYLILQVYMPPAAQWPAQSNGTKEVQVVMSFNVYDNGNLIGTLGTGQQYTVTCPGAPAGTKTTSGKKH